MLSCTRILSIPEHDKTPAVHFNAPLSQLIISKANFKFQDPSHLPLFYDKSYKECQTFFSRSACLRWRWKQTEQTAGMRTMMAMTTPTMTARRGSGSQEYLAPILPPRWVWLSVSWSVQLVSGRHVWTQLAPTADKWPLESLEVIVLIEYSQYWLGTLKTNLSEAEATLECWERPGRSWEGLSVSDHYHDKVLPDTNTENISLCSSWPKVC